MRLGRKKPGRLQSFALPRDVTPAVRVREVFAVFVPNERRRTKRIRKLVCRRGGPAGFLALLTHGNLTVP